MSFPTWLTATQAKPIVEYHFGYAPSSSMLNLIVWYPIVCKMWLNKKYFMELFSVFATSSDVRKNG